MRFIRAVALLSSITLLFVPAVFAQSVCAPTGGLTFTTSLAGSQFGGNGAPNGFGTGFITINPANNTATVTLNVNGIGSNITGAGLFQSPNGGSFSNVFIPFTDVNNTFQNGMLTRTIILTPSQINAILANPNAFSFGVTTGEFPNGAVSGTLTSNQLFSGTFSGTSIVGTTGASNAGGGFTAQLSPNTSGTGFVLNFSFLPTGIGDTITGLNLFQGMAGTNGTLVTNLASAAVLANGRLTGSIPLTTAQAQQLMMNPSAFFVTANTASFPSGAIRAQLSTASNELWLPVVGAVSGAGASLWATDINIFNEAYGAPATVVAEYLPANQSNAISGSTAINAANTTTITVQPRGTNLLTGALNSLFQLTNGLGAVHLVSNQPIAASARIYNDQRANGRGTLGQTYMALTRCEAFARGVLVGVTGGTASNGSAASRTNIGFFNPTGVPVTVQLNLGDMQGNSAAANTITLQPFGMQQIPMVGNGGLFANASANFSSGAVTYVASAPIFTYASVVDNASGDTSIMFAKEDVSATPISETDVAAIVTAANSGEVTVSQLGVSRATSNAVRQFAQQMVNEHTLSLQQAQALFNSIALSSSTNATSMNLTNLSIQTVNSLNAQPSGNAFDRTFMQNEVNMHQMVLNLIDNTLLPSARNGQFIQFLQTMRAEVATHLQLAQSVLATLPA